MDILVIVANAELLRILSDVLGTEGHQVWKAKDAREAYRTLLSRMPDAVVIDARLPDGSGIEVLRTLRDSPGGRAVSAVLVSDDPLTTRWEARELKPERVLGKPLDVLDLCDLIRDLAAERRGRPDDSLPPDPPDDELSPQTPLQPEPRATSPRWSSAAPTIPPTGVPFPPPRATLPPTVITAPAPPPPAAPKTSRSTRPRQERTTQDSPPVPASQAQARPQALPTDPWELLGVPRDATPEDIQEACERLIDVYTETAQNERNLDARARASYMVARVRAAKRTLLGGDASESG